MTYGSSTSSCMLMNKLTIDSDYRGTSEDVPPGQRTVVRVSVHASCQAETASIVAYSSFSTQISFSMDWLLHGLGKQTAHHQSSTPSQQGTAPVPIPGMVPQLQGDPTFLYGGYGYRPPTFGYAWTGASQRTSFAQLPTDSSSKEVSSPKTLSKSASAPDLLNQAAMQEAQKKAQPKKQHSSLFQHATPPVPRHRKHLTMGHAPPGTPGESAANTPSSSRASTPPRRRGMDDSFYIGMAAA